jgi:hypothetical protein
MVGPLAAQVFQQSISFVDAVFFFPGPMKNGDRVRSKSQNGTVSLDK